METITSTRRTSAKKASLLRLGSFIHDKERREFLRSYCNKYEKTPKGFVMRMYRNMKSRIEGVQKNKAHLYVGKELIEKQTFYNWILNNPTFKHLFNDYEDAGFPMKLAPTVDRLDSSKGYILENMEIVTHSVNSKRGVDSKNKNLEVYIEFNRITQTLSDWAKEIGITVAGLRFRLKKLSVEEALTRPKSEKRPLVHGTVHGYVTYKCRCAPCTKGNRNYGRERIKRIKQGI